MRHSAGTTRRMIAAIVAGLVASGCTLSRAPVSRATSPTWASVDCEQCEAHNVTVEVRHSVDAQGRQGRFAFARVTNLNPHGVALTVEFTSEEPPIHDQRNPAEQRSLTLGQAGHDSAASVLMLRSSTVRSVIVERVERYE